MPEPAERAKLELIRELSTKYKVLSERELNARYTIFCESYVKTVNIEDLQDVNNKPGAQITLPATTIYEPGNATLTFDPTPGAAIEDFSQGEHVVKVIYWKVTEGRGSARSFTWTFNVF